MCFLIEKVIVDDIATFKEKVEISLEELILFLAQMVVVRPQFRILLEVTDLTRRVL